MSDPLYSLQAGEFIPQCWCTVDLIVKAIEDIWIRDHHLSKDSGIIRGVVSEPNGLIRVTLSLAAGTRVKVGGQ
jgi:hypothetical protein